MAGSRETLRSTLAVALVGVLALTSILALSALFAQSDQVTRVVERARTLQALEELVGAATATRGATAVALLMGEAHQRGYATDVQLSQAAEDLGVSLAEMSARSARLEDLRGPVPDVSAAVADASHAGTQIAGHLEGGDVVGAAAAVVDLRAALAALDGALAQERAGAFSLLVAEEGTAGSLVRSTSIAVAFLVPGSALMLFRWRQARRHRQVELELQVSHIQEQGRIKDQMIANLSHELRTPLTGIYGMAMAMQEEGFDDAAFQAEMTGIIIEQAADLARMVDDLLVAAKADSGDLTFHTVAVDAAAEVAEVVSGFQAGDRPISVQCADAEVTADRLRLRHLIGNLVSNAIRHGGAGIEIVGERAGNQYRISINDDGDGVPEQLVPLLFERYVHEGDAPLTSGSVGLGLAVTRILARGMNGEVSHQRRNGITTFSLVLPLADVPQADSPWEVATTA